MAEYQLSYTANEINEILAKADADYSTATNLENGVATGSLKTLGATASGEYSMAFGYYPTASGDYSMACGNYAEASKNFSTALGVRTTASGYASMALGYYATASGDYSMACGSYVTANEDYSMAFGCYGKQVNGALLTIGNGTNINQRCNAFVAYKDGRASVQSAPKNSEDVVRLQELQELQGLPQKAGWKITKHVFNHSFSFSSGNITHSGFGNFVEYEDMNNSARHMITADIHITSSENITTPEDFKVLMTTLGTKWTSAGMLVNALFPDGFKDATKYTHMTVDKYSWITDQTEGSVGLLDGVGAVLPQVYAVRNDNGYNASLWGIAVELTKTNSGKSFLIDGKHIGLTFYDFHTVTDA